MELRLGHDVIKPSVGLNFSNGEFDQLKKVRKFPLALEMLTSARDVSITNSDQNLNLTFLLTRIARRPLDSHSQRLRPVITILDSASMFLNPDARFSDLIIGDKYISGRLPLGARIQWPEAVSDERLSLHVTKVMRSMARQLRYASGGRDNTSVGIYAHVNRSDPSTIMGVSLQTDPFSSASIETIGEDYVSENPSFWLECHNLYEYKQQLICLAGALAIAQADELVTT